MNHSLKIKAASGEPEIKKILMDKGFIFYPNQHAYWRASGKGASVIFYNNGSLLIQGEKSALDALRDLFTFDNKQFPDNLSRTLGLDESGKGDYFGPLVLAGAIVTTDNKKILENMGVMDSKKLSDKAIKSIYPDLINNCINFIKIIEPEEYNKKYNHFKNLNLLMIDQYISLINTFPANEYDRIILDRFSNSDAQNRSIRERYSKEFIIVEKAEINLSVAAASVLARYAFISWLDDKSSETGLNLPKGSGPGVMRALKEISMNNSSGMDKLVKLHFKGAMDNYLI